jgi:hypothetical protein
MSYILVGLIHSSSDIRSRTVPVARHPYVVLSRDSAKIPASWIIVSLGRAEDCLLLDSLRLCPDIASSCLANRRGDLGLRGSINDGWPPRHSKSGRHDGKKQTSRTDNKRYIV